MYQKKLAEILEKKNISMYKVSKLTGVSTATLHRIMKKNHEPKISTVIKITKALNIKIEELF